MLTSSIKVKLILFIIKQLSSQCVYQSDLKFSVRSTSSSNMHIL